LREWKQRRQGKYGLLFSGPFRNKDDPVPGVDYRRVREQISMADVIELAGLTELQVSGDELRGPCPVHDSESPKSRAFAVNLGKNAYYCHKCGAAGNQLDLWAALNKLTLHEAAIDLCKRSNVEVPWIRRW
jgi:DNA primase